MIFLEKFLQTKNNFFQIWTIFYQYPILKILIFKISSRVFFLSFENFLSKKILIFGRKSSKEPRRAGRQQCKKMVKNRMAHFGIGAYPAPYKKYPIFKLTLSIHFKVHLSIIFQILKSV